MAKLLLQELAGSQAVSVGPLPHITHGDNNDNDIPLSYTITIPQTAATTHAAVQAKLCPLLLSAVLSIFTSANAPVQQVDNAQNGCANIHTQSGAVSYTTSIMTNLQGNLAAVAAFTATQAGDASFPLSVHLMCGSQTLIFDTETGVRWAKLGRGNLKFLQRGGGCFTQLPLKVWPSWAHLIAECACPCPCSPVLLNTSCSAVESPGPCPRPACLGMDLPG